MSESEKPVTFQSYLRLCGVVLLALLCTTAVEIATSFSHLGPGWTLKVTIIISIAVANAFLVVGYLMHLLSEKKAIYTMLAIVVIFFAALMGLTMWAMTDFPTGTIAH